MKIQERAVLHNRFDVRVVDTASGKVKQTAVGFNVITNYYFNSRLTASPLSKTTDLFRYIAVGTGTGTPAVTDTALFTHLTRKAVTTLDTVYEYPTSYTAKQIKLEATECNGSTITAYHYTGGAWTSKTSVTDSTYSAAGYVGLTSVNAVATFDDFYAGTITASTYTPHFLSLMGVGG